jgi:hypothetical protein
VGKCRRELIKNDGWQGFCKHYCHPDVVTKTRTKTVTYTPRTTATVTTTAVFTEFSTETATESSPETKWTTTTIRGGSDPDPTPIPIQKRNHRSSIEYDMRRYPSRVIMSACASAVGKTRVIYRTRTVTRTLRQEVTTTTTKDFTITTATHTASPSYPCGDIGGPGQRPNAVFMWDANHQTPTPGENLDMVRTEWVLLAKECCDLCWRVQGGGCALWRLSKKSSDDGGLLDFVHCKES